MIIGSFVFDVLLVATSTASAHQPPHRYPMSVQLVRIENAQHEVIALAAQGAPSLLVYRQSLRGQTPVFVCAAPGRCGQVTAVIDCAQTNEQIAGCGPTMLWIQHTPILAEVVVPQPPMVQPSLYDPCTQRPNEPWEHGAAVSLGPSFAIHDGRPQFGFTFAPGYRRFVPHSQPNSWRNPECADSTPYYRHERGGAWIGTELGVDFRGHIHWSFPSNTSEVSGSIGIAPIMRLLVAGGHLRIPSILGLLVPEVGVRTRSVKYDQAGARLRGSNSESSLYLRPAGLSIAYLFSGHPVLGAELSAAPWVEIPFNGQPVNVGFSVSLQFVAIGWD